eukprot:2940281-Amphidinium_carterae.1
MCSIFFGGGWAGRSSTESNTTDINIKFLDEQASNQSSNQAIKQSSNQAINQSIKQSSNQSINAQLQGTPNISLHRPNFLTCWNSSCQAALGAHFDMCVWNGLSVCAKPPPKCLERTDRVLTGGGIMADVPPSSGPCHVAGTGRRAP